MKGGKQSLSLFTEHEQRELKRLVHLGYAETVDDVVRYIVMRGLDDLRRSPVLAPREVVRVEEVSPL
jgi:hypothetical protein